MDLPRDPHYYRKELDFVISRSYGPGRYDAGYEEGGLDYPYGFVRWTEGRNMASFLEAAATGGVDLPALITHRFPLEQAEDAYRIVTGERVEPHIGIVLTYAERARAEKTVALRPVAAAATPGTLRIGFAGAGSFARSYLLPHLKGRSGVELVKVATAKGFTADRRGAAVRVRGGRQRRGGAGPRPAPRRRLHRHPARPSRAARRRGARRREARLRREAAGRLPRAPRGPAPRRRTRRTDRPDRLQPALLAAGGGAA